jgi:hypothetical protein
VKVEFTPEQLSKLIEMAYLGEWMINSQHSDEFRDETAIAALQGLMAGSRIEGIECDPESGDYYLDNEWAEQIYDRYVVDYDEHVFWDELAERLAQRDLARERRLPTEEIDRDDDRIDLRPIEDRYRNEMEENGLDRIEVVGDF